MFQSEAITDHCASQAQIPDLAPITLTLSDGQIVESLVRRCELDTWGREPGQVYTVFKWSGDTHELIARWKVSPEGALLSLSVDKQNTLNLVADADTLRAFVQRAQQKS